jgi:hypothetical protein
LELFSFGLLRQSYTSLSGDLADDNERQGTRLILNLRSAAKNGTGVSSTRDVSLDVRFINNPGVRTSLGVMTSTAEEWSVGGRSKN